MPNEVALDQARYIWTCVASALKVGAVMEGEIRHDPAFFLLGQSLVKAEKHAA